MKKHKHEPVFERYYRNYSGNDLNYRVGLFHCAIEGCLATGQLEEWPQEDDRVIWIDRQEDSSSRV